MKIKTSKINSDNAEIADEIPKEMIDTNIKKIAKEIKK